MDVTLYIGERLGYPEEKITTGTPEELEQGSYDDLCVALIENSTLQGDPLLRGG